MEPQNVPNTPVYEGVQSPVMPPQAPPPPMAGGPTVSPPERKTSRRLLIIMGALGVLLLVLFLIVKFVVPLISGPKEIKLSWWGLWEDPNIVAPLISEYESAHKGVKIDYVKQSQKDYRERLTNALSQGQGPDIFRFHNTWVPMFAKSLDTAPASVINASDFTESYYPVASADLVSGSGIVGIPLEYDALTLFINDDIFVSAGKSAPTTWDDLRALAPSLTIKDDRGVITQSGVALGRTENVDHWPEILALLMLQNRTNLNSPSGELGEKALEYFTQFSRVDKVWDETLPTSTEAFAGGKLAMYFGPHWRSFEISQKNPNLKFHTVKVPQLPKDSPTDPDVSYATYWAEGVSAGSKNKAAAWEFLKFLSSSETLTKFYESASKARGFGEPYPRVEMASLLTSHPILGSIITLAPQAKSWYLASDTFDGPTGINSQMINYFRDAVNAVNKGSTSKEALSTATLGVSQVLTQFGLRR